jgi:imidazolonepropionase-like amidohydrolase
MKTNPLLLLRFLVLTSLLVSAVPGYSQGAQAQGAFAVTGVRVFDGTRVIPSATVVVEGGRITAVGPEVRPPAGAEVIGGAGKTLLPGFIDAHTHSFGDALARALAFGVTTEMEMFGMPGLAQALREEQAKTGAPQRADLFSSGTLATAPGGHGTQYGIPIPTISKPEEAEAFVAARFAEGSDYLKIISEDGHGYGRDRPTLDTPTIKALVQATHGKGKIAVIHVSTQERAKAALESGADGLVHIFVDGAPEPGFGALAARTKAFVVPTLTVVESSVGGSGGRSVAADPRLAPYLRGEEVENLNRAMPARPEAPARLEHAVAAVRALKAAGVPILAGSDAPNPGTSHGASLHREMEMLVQAAGLSPTEALAAATSVPAKAFGLDDRGRIAPGLRADLVLVQGDPSTDITATREIVRIWKAGHPVERKKVETPAPKAP